MKDNKNLFNTTQKGKEAENFACKFLIEQGFAILERNFHTRFGELDIVAKKNGILHFVEVKSGVGFEPIYNLTPAKLEKLTKTLNVYLNQQRIQDPYCLSALVLSKQAVNDDFRAHWLENLTIF
ncbi:YraN family protein [Helicobacter sp.]|uniref:YraN family protein n=1 Tax=Helicobacter sp. TaxID=218 RepID=UPI0019CAFB50|nr:YraN family protein [Helicobacter sp.]MBD5165013.1 YraN family protein [Helicobacter sp.]